ncbi:hypothetical protein Y032_0157g3189 [Ancylostoma ceylanicum]|nr:hypothetical protein Y032_0157g3189 [Ancylostoma ceylanicum]
MRHEKLMIHGLFLTLHPYHRSHRLQSRVVRFAQSWLSSPLFNHGTTRCGQPDVPFTKRGHGWWETDDFGLRARATTVLLRRKTSYSDLLRIFDKNGFPPETNYLFLGDYVDRGRQNIETICLMFCYRIKYSESFFMLRGNHECPAINRVYGFYEECNRRYKSSRLWSSFQDTFNWMPLCGFIAGRILCMHGGLSPQLTNIDQLRNLPRPQDPPNPSMGIDLLWADPDQWVKGWQANTRGVSYVFGQDVVIDTCQKLNIDLIARAHQVVQDGYEFFASKKMVTIFSAPHYCGQFDNFAATMKNSLCSVLLTSTPNSQFLIAVRKLFIAFAKLDAEPEKIVSSRLLNTSSDDVSENVSKHYKNAIQAHMLFMLYLTKSLNSKGGVAWFGEHALYSCLLSPKLN